MAGGVNKVILVGNLGSDPEVRYTPSGQPVANFNIATSESWTDKTGQKQDRTEWHRIVVWGKLAELCGEYLGKGRQMAQRLFNPRGAFAYKRPRPLSLFDRPLLHQLMHGLAHGDRTKGTIHVLDCEGLRQLLDGNRFRRGLCGRGKGKWQHNSTAQAKRSRGDQMFRQVFHVVISSFQ